MIKDCIFCRVGTGDVTSDLMYRNEYCFAIRDIAPKAPVHILIIPNQHFTYLSSLSPSFYPVLGEMFSAARTLAETQGVISSGYRLVINQGTNSGQQVAHLHLHLLAGRPLEEMG